MPRHHQDARNHREGLFSSRRVGNTNAVSVKLKGYVWLVATVGVGLLLGLAVTADWDRSPRELLTIALFAGFVVVGELLVVPIRHRGTVRELTATNTFAYALVLLAGPAIGVVALGLGSVVADLVRRKTPVKIVFNAAQWAIALTAGGAVTFALGGRPPIGVDDLAAFAAGGAVFLLVNHVLVGVVVSLAAGTPIIGGLLEDLRVEAATSAMLLALAPVAVVIAQQALLLVPALLLPLVAVHRASRGEVEADARRAQAEALADQQRQMAAVATAQAEHERRLAEQERQLVRSLQETDRLKADLIAGVTHELRTPLTTISGVLQTLNRRGVGLAGDDRAELVAMALRQSERLRRMIEQLLLAARFQDGDGVIPLPLPQAPVDVSDLVRQAGAEARARHHDRRIAIETNGALPVRVAQDAVVQVLGNLLDNACKYSPDGEPVRLSCGRDGDEVVLVVEDSGPGIPAADRQRIFERFTQLDAGATHRAGGVGLGLYLARQLAHSQGGRLVVADPVGEVGARFELRLPLLGEAVGS
jgi:signal transduction histidine kinase